MVKSIIVAISASGALGYKTDLTLVNKVSKSTENEIAGFGLDLQYWTESESLVLQFIQQVPVAELKPGNIIQSYVQLLHGQDDSGKDKWDVALCTASFPGYDTIDQTEFKSYDSYLAINGASVHNSSKGYVTFMSASLVADAGQDWTVEELTKDQFGSGVTCTVTTCTFKCQMQRKLKTEETDKDVQMAIGDEETVLGGYRLY